MTNRNQALQVEIAARRVNERRRRATTQRPIESGGPSRLLWWLGGLAAGVMGASFLF